MLHFLHGRWLADQMMVTSLSMKALLPLVYFSPCSLRKMAAHEREVHHGRANSQAGLEDTASFWKPRISGRIRSKTPRLRTTGAPLFYHLW